MVCIACYTTADTFYCTGLKKYICRPCHKRWIDDEILMLGMTSREAAEEGLLEEIGWIP